MQINWLQYRYLYYDGYGRFGTNLLRALLRLGVNVWAGLEETLNLNSFVLQLSGFDPTRLSLHLMPPHNVHHHTGRQWMFTMTEAAGLPDGWARAMNVIAERVIVPCPWLVDVFREQRVLRPIEVIPGGVNPSDYPLVNPPDRPFTFMCLGDRAGRKGHLDVWQAFHDEFQDEWRDVRLIIKRRSYGPRTYPVIDNTNSESPLIRSSVKIWAEDVSSMAEAYPFADAFLFPSHGEGWGMPPREAACMGIPTVVTRWSGLEVGIDHWATRIIEKHTVAPAPTVPNALQGDWVLPDKEELQAHMRWLYENREEARAKARQGALWLRENQTWDHSARALLDLLEKYN